MNLKLSINTECLEEQRRLIELRIESLTRWAKDTTDNGGDSADTSKGYITFVLVMKPKIMYGAFQRNNNH